MPMAPEKLEALINAQTEERTRILGEIVNSTSPKKVIVSGPGTGKTHTFKEVLKAKSGKSLALTFIRALAKKLETDLKDYAEVGTFHSFCKAILHKIEKTDLTTEFILFPNLESIIKKDFQILHTDSKQCNFAQAFRELDSTKESHIAFFLKRSSYYDTVSFDDSVYRVAQFLKANPSQIPIYEQIVVDEYQDFNKLEVDFLDILSQTSPILIVGDDDQALYGRLKSASSEFIRNKYADPIYQKFCLPFCSRCTWIVTKAIEDIIKQAKSVGKLENRIDKRYDCFLPSKLADSKHYRTITYAQCSVNSSKTPYLARFIESEIDKLSKEEILAANQDSDYTVLVVGSTHYIEQIQKHFCSLGKYRLYCRKDDHNSASTIWEGYKLLLEHGVSANIGWRVIMEHDSPQDIKAIINQTATDLKKLVDILPRSYTETHQAILDIFKKLLIGLPLTAEETSHIADKFHITPVDVLEKIKDPAESTTDPLVNPEEIRIIFTTNVGCKGLSAGYVFVTGLDEGVLPKKNSSPTNIEIRNFIVALTRTVKKAYLLSTYRFAGKPCSPSVFTSWIHPKRLNCVSINKDYFHQPVL